MQEHLFARPMPLAELIACLEANPAGFLHAERKQRPVLAMV
jgi:hypothetical protein